MTCRVRAAGAAQAASGRARARKTGGSMRIALEVNGEKVVADVEAGWSLLRLLRDGLGLMGTREGCGHGDCGSCTVLVDGKPALSCILFAFQADGASVTTIEGVSEGERLDLIQRCFVEKGAIQCGFCTPAMVLVAKSLLDENRRPSRQEIRQAISGVLCRCTGYKRIVDAVEAAARLGSASGVGCGSGGNSPTLNSFRPPE
jgi:aerobic carbon-monoxide dehydrogenase small subunit